MQDITVSAETRPHRLDGFAQVTRLVDEVDEIGADEQLLRIARRDLQLFGEMIP